MNDKDLKNIFQEHYRDEKNPLSDSVWVGIEEELNKKKKRRFIFWWFLGSFFGVIFLLIVMYNFSDISIEAFQPRSISLKMNNDSQNLNSRQQSDENLNSLIINDLKRQKRHHSVNNEEEIEIKSISKEAINKKEILQRSQPKTNSEKIIQKTNVSNKSDTQEKKNVDGLNQRDIESKNINKKNDSTNFSFNKYQLDLLTPKTIVSKEFNIENQHNNVSLKTPKYKYIALEIGTFFFNQSDIIFENEQATGFSAQLEYGREFMNNNFTFSDFSYQNVILTNSDTNIYITKIADPNNPVVTTNPDSLYDTIYDYFRLVEQQQNINLTFGFSKELYLSNRFTMNIGLQFGTTIFSNINIKRRDNKGVKYKYNEYFNSIGVGSKFTIGYAFNENFDIYFSPIILQNIQINKLFITKDRLFFGANLGLKYRFH